MSRKLQKTRHSRPRTTRGFTLVEVMVTLPLVALLFGGTLALFIAGQQMVQRTTTAVQSSQDAATGQQFITSIAREAIQFSLPPDTTTTNTNGIAFLPPDGRVGDYQSSSGMNTAVEMLMPSTAASVKTVGQAATPGLNLLDRTGSSISPASYDRTSAETSGGQPLSPLVGDILCIFRADANGNPSPNNGQFLWSVRRPAGTALSDGSHDVVQKICKFILTVHADGTPATDAVQFVGRNTPGADIPISMPYELEFKLVCGDQTSINGTQTNEATDGSSISALVGKCVLLRNHN